ncbi:hypothetical protein RRSWK_04273 [Rhodopirellula sp. SWK7]|nr:hypothetical protein RRSWK_04273 [Rhodopirellula sp. SWK7]
MLRKNVVRHARPIGLDEVSGKADKVAVQGHAKGEFPLSSERCIGFAGVAKDDSRRLIVVRLVVKGLWILSPRGHSPLP